MENNKCEKCGGEMVVKENNQTGAKFLACNNFPACKNSKPMPKEDKVEVVDMVEKAARDYAVKNDDKVYKHLTEPKSNGFKECHLSTEQINTNAIDLVLRMDVPFDWELVYKVEKYIRFGE